MQKKEEKRKNENRIVLDGKNYHLHKIIWTDIVGNTALESSSEFTKMKPA